MRKIWMSLIVFALVLSACTPKPTGNEDAPVVADEAVEEPAVLTDADLDRFVTEVPEEELSEPARVAARYIRAFYAMDVAACTELLHLCGRKAFINDLYLSLSENLTDEQIAKTDFDFSIDPTDDAAFSAFYQVFMEGMTKREMRRTVTEETIYDADSEEGKKYLDGFHAEEDSGILEVCVVNLNVTYIDKGKLREDKTEVVCVKTNDGWSMLTYGF